MDRSVTRCRRTRATTGAWQILGSASLAAVVSGVLVSAATAQAPSMLEERYGKSRGESPARDSDRSPFEVEVLTRKLAAPYFFAPWAAALVQATRNPQQGLFCGATLIHRRWAVTAAFCVEGVAPGAIELRYGADTLERSKRAAIREIVMHPAYRPPRQENGLALLRLVDELPANKLPYPRIPDRPFARASDSPDARVVGWGAISEQGRVSGQLVQIDATVLAQEYCNSPTVYAGRVAPDMLCAAAKLADIDACQGFSGSGLVSQGGAEARLVGIVSWGEGCGRPHRPTVYTQIGAHAGWIRGVVRGR